MGTVVWWDADCQVAPFRIEPITNRHSGAHCPHMKRDSVFWMFAGDERSGSVSSFKRGGIAAVFGAVAVAAVTVACTAHTVQTTGTSGSTATPGKSAQAQAKAVLGTAITLAGDGSGEQVSATVVKVMSTAKPGDDFSSAPAGDRLYAVQFRIRDTGKAAYSDTPSNGAAVTDSAGQTYNAGLADTVQGCISFPSIETITPGSTGLGCVAFEVPRSAKITGVQFTLNSGMGPQTGQWTVG